jgi:hypothetical protein
VDYIICQGRINNCGLKEMGKNDKNKKYSGSSEFIKIIDLAVHEGADSITIEYDDGLEVCNWIGNAGIADVFVDRDFEKELIGYIFEAAKLENKQKGSIVVELHRIEYTINVEEYNHFGESAFKLTFKKEI